MTEAGKMLRNIDEILAHTSDADFDGHSAFADLTPAERLDWLDEIASFVVEFKGRAIRRRKLEK